MTLVLGAKFESQRALRNPVHRSAPSKLNISHHARAHTLTEGKHFRLLPSNIKPHQGQSSVPVSSVCTNPTRGTGQQGWLKTDCSSLILGSEFLRSLRSFSRQQGCSCQVFQGICRAKDCGSQILLALVLGWGIGNTRGSQKCIPGGESSLQRWQDNLNWVKFLNSQNPQMPLHEEGQGSGRQQPPATWEAAGLRLRQ